MAVTRKYFTKTSITKNKKIVGKKTKINIIYIFVKMKRILNYLLVLVLTFLFYKCVFHERIYNSKLYFKIVNYSDSNLIVYYSYYRTDTSAKNKYVGYIDKKQKDLLPKDSFLIGPFFTPYLIEDINKVNIYDIFDDTIFINRKNGMSINKNIYFKTNWNYLLQKSRDKKKFDSCIMQMYIWNKDL